jgi:hypothetical protein
MRTYRPSLSAITLVCLFIFLGSSINAQENGNEQQIVMDPSTGTEVLNSALEDLASELMRTLPKTGTYAIQDVTEESSGLPQQLVKQISSSLQSSLMIASDFEMKLIDQSQQNSAWANAIEFNGADFEEVLENSAFDALIVPNFRATNDGIDVSLQAIGAGSENAGEVLASTSLRSVAIDWEKTASADLSGKTSKKILEIQAELEKLRLITEPVRDPVTFADFIHNARIYQSRGELDDTITSLESAVKIEPNFVDIAFDLTQLLVKRYGAENAKKYIEKRLKPSMKTDMSMLLALVVDPNNSGIGPWTFSNQELDFPPLAAQWIWGAGQQVLDDRSTSSEPYAQDYAILTAARMVTRSFSSGQFQNYFLDPLRASDFARNDDAKALEQRLNRLEYSVFISDYAKGTGNLYYDMPGVCRIAALFYPEPMPQDLKLRKEKECGNFYDLSRDNGFLKNIFEHDGIAYPNNSLAQIESPTGDPISLEDIFVSGTPRVTSPCYLGPSANTSYQPDGSELTVSQSAVEPYLDDRVEPKEYEILTETSTQLPLSELVFPTVATDRLVFADFCLKGDESFTKLVGISELLITDDVDTSKPILVEALVPSGSDEIHSITVDVSRDGTTFSDSGLPVDIFKGEGQLWITPRPANYWLWAPGVVQSLIGRTNIISVTYTDTFGEKKTVNKSKIFLNASEEFVSLHSLEKNGFIGDNQRFALNLISGYTFDASQDWSYLRNNTKESSEHLDDTASDPSFASDAGAQATEGFEDSSAWQSLGENGSCFPAFELAYTPTNIDEYVTMRSEPSTEAGAVEKIAKGSILFRADETVYLGNNSGSAGFCRSLCTAENNDAGTSEESLAVCIQDNGLWYKLKSDSGALGYISAKFLAISTDPIYD